MEGLCLQRAISEGTDRVRGRETVNEVCVETMRHSSTTTTTLEQETTCHVRSESCPQDSDSSVFGLWVRAAEETVTAARTALDVLTSVVVIPPPSLPMMRRLSTVLGHPGLVDFEASMIIEKLREVDR